MKAINKTLNIKTLLEEGEGQKVEFKEKISSIATVIVAFANANGGNIYIGITDEGRIAPVKLTNHLKSQLIDIARNCDPPVRVAIHADKSGVVVISVPEGSDRPYKCKEGFFLRIGPTSQKLGRDEIIQLINHAGKIKFDEIISEDFSYPGDFDAGEWERYARLAGYPRNMPIESALVNIGVASSQERRLLFTNAAVLFFAKEPQRFLPEARIICLKYRGQSRFDIQDRRDFGGTILRQLEEAAAFFDRYNAKQIKITGRPQHEEWEDYPAVAVREAVINALVHRDYFYDSSCVYMHIYDGFLEIDNPGGLIKGLSLEDLGLKAARRNRMLADLMQRAGYIENAGTGILRIKEALRKNNNPPPEFSATNFFSVKFVMRPKNLTDDVLTDRQRTLCAFIARRGPVSKTECQKFLNIGSDTVLGELKALISKGLVGVSGKSKNTRYFLP